MTNPTTMTRGLKGAKGISANSLCSEHLYHEMFVPLYLSSKVALNLQEYTEEKVQKFRSRNGLFINLELLSLRRNPVHTQARKKNQWA